MSKCRSCNQIINFVRTTTGKFMPVNPEKVPYGNLEVVDEGGEAPTVRFVKPDFTPRYRSHFSTCPEAKKHRKQKTPSDADPDAVAKPRARRRDEMTQKEKRAQDERRLYEEVLSRA